MVSKTVSAKQTAKDSTDSYITTIKEARCKTLSGKSDLTYNIGLDTDGEIYFKVASNNGGGFFSDEWVKHKDVQAAFQAWPADTPITSMTLRKIFHGKSANTPAFLLASLTAEGLLEPMPDRKRCHQACDPAPFLASLEDLQNGKATTNRKKPAAKKQTAAKSKAKPRAKAKAAPKAKAATKAKAPSTRSANNKRKAAVKNPKSP